MQFETFPPAAHRGPEVLTVASLLGRVQGALARAFPRNELIWVRGEIQSITDRTGHCYLELVDPDSRRGRETRVLKVNCWQRTWAPMRAALGGQGIVLDVGTVVAFRGRVEFYAPRGQVNFIAVDVDVDALLGRAAAQRAALLKALEAEGLLGRNRQLPVPVPALRVGLVASPGTDGCNDFLGQLEGSGLAFRILLVPTPVQGRVAPAALARGITVAAASACHVVVVVRGGGAKADLVAFDSELVARAIARCPVSVWTGVGHTGDQSVADVVAGRAFVTPTECGQELVRQATAWWESVTTAAATVRRGAGHALDAAAGRDIAARRRLAAAARHQLQRHGERLDHDTRRIVGQARRQLDMAASTVDQKAARLVPGARRAVAQQGDRVATWRRLLAAYDVGRQLERGYSLTVDTDGRIVRSVGSLSRGSVLVTRLADGSAVSEVRTVEPVAAAASSEASLGIGEEPR